jgi:hypothetical protein
VLSPMELQRHCDIIARRSFGEVHYPEVGPVAVLPPPFRFSEATAVVRGRLVVMCLCIPLASRAFSIRTFIKAIRGRTD